MDLLNEGMRDFDALDKHPKDDSLSEAEWLRGSPPFPYEQLVQQADGAAGGTRVRLPSRRSRARARVATARRRATQA